MIELYPQTYKCEPLSAEYAHMDPQDWQTLKARIEAALQSATNADGASQLDGYFYRYADGALRLDSRERNGSGPTEAIPYWTQPTL